MKIDLEEVSLKFLNLDYFFYSFSEIKLRTIFSELALFQLSKIKNVIDEEAQNLGARLLNLYIILTLSMNVL